jgi:HSP20 family protein
MTQTTEPTTAVARRNETLPTHWNSWNELSEMRRHFDDLFTRMFGHTPLSRMFPTPLLQNEPAADIYETDDKIVAYAALPGFTPEALDVQASADTITIRGERKAAQEDDKAVAHRNNGLTGYSTVNVTYTLPSEIDPNKIKATFTNGILNLEMPKTEKARNNSVKVKVKAE